MFDLEPEYEVLVDWTPIMTPPELDRINLAEQFEKALICRMFGVTPEQLGLSIKDCAASSQE